MKIYRHKYSLLTKLSKSTDRNYIKLHKKLYKPKRDVNYVQFISSFIKIFIRLFI